MHLWERKCFRGIVIDSSLKSKMMKIEEAYTDTCYNPNALKHFKTLLDIHPNDSDIWHQCAINYLNMPTAEKTIQTYDVYMKIYMCHDYCKNKIDAYKSKMSTSLKRKYESGDKVAKFDHFFPEYWIKKGYSEEAAIDIVNKRKYNAHTKSAEIKSQRDDVYLMHTSYWVKKGYSEDEAKMKVTDRQTTFTLEKCIEKLGPEHGYNRWLLRQQTWMATINSKSPEDIAIMNSKKIKNSKGSVSKQEKLLYCMMNDERITPQGIVGKYTYDFVCGKNIVEYNGDFWHCNPKLFSEDAKVYKKTAKQIWEYDAVKNGAAIASGYNVLVVWESDFIKNKEAVVERCKQFLLS